MSPETIEAIPSALHLFVILFLLKSVIFLLIDRRKMIKRDQAYLDDMIEYKDKAYSKDGVRLDLMLDKPEYSDYVLKHYRH